MRFLVDMNLAPEVAAWLRAQGHDAVHLRELGLQELGDQAVLAKAIAEKRVVLTSTSTSPTSRPPRVRRLSP